MIEQAKDQFPMLKKTVHGHPFIYLDSAATAQKPQAVIDAMSDFYTNHYGTVHRAIYTTAVEASDAYQQSRKTIAAFLGAKSEDEIIFHEGHDRRY